MPDFPRVPQLGHMEPTRVVVVPAGGFMCIGQDTKREKLVQQPLFGVKENVVDNIALALNLRLHAATPSTHL